MSDGSPSVSAAQPKPLELVTVAAPPVDQRVRRDARFANPGEKRSRYSLPTALDSGSPVGYRTRIGLSQAEGRAALKLLSLQAPTGFGPAALVLEGELFEECALGVLSSRQSTNYRGHRQVSFGPDDSQTIAGIVRSMNGTEVPVLDGASYTHVILSRPYRTPFTLLLTFVGHKPVRSLMSVPARAARKRLFHETDIPTIGYLQQLHLGILADTLERGVVVASRGLRRAQIIQAPFCGRNRERNAGAIARLERMCKLGADDRRAGWRVSTVVQVGTALDDERVIFEGEEGEGLSAEDAQALWPKLGANLLAFRSERIQPGVNNEAKAPVQFRARQDMDVPEEFTIQAGRAAYNAFARWTGFDREGAKELLMLDRVDVLTPGGKERLRKIRDKLESITDRVVAEIPKWADLPLAKALSRNAERGRKAFALAGQRIYIAGLSQREIEKSGLDWDLALRAVGACSCRGGLYAEIMGVVDLPEDCDLLAGICMMAGPVNQDDIGKTHYGMPDLMTDNPAFAGRDPTALLVWTLKAKTIADPIGNEEQLLNAARKGALVDLRAAPHEVIGIARGGRIQPMRARAGKHNRERAFAQLDNFVRGAEGIDIPGNLGEPWPQAWREERVW